MAKKLGLVVALALSLLTTTDAREVYAVSQTEPARFVSDLVTQGHETIVQSHELERYEVEGVTYFIDPILFRKDRYQSLIELYQSLANQVASRSELTLNEFGYRILENSLGLAHHGIREAAVVIEPSVTLDLKFENQRFRLINVLQSAGITDSRKNLSMLQDRPLKPGASQDLEINPQDLANLSYDQPLSLTVVSASVRGPEARVRDNETVSQIIAREERALLAALGEAKQTFRSTISAELGNGANLFMEPNLSDLRQLGERERMSLEANVSNILRSEGMPTDEASLARFWANATIDRVRVKYFFQLVSVDNQGAPTIINVELP